MELYNNKKDIWQLYTSNQLDSEKVIVKGDGIYLWDDHDRKYIDGLSGLGVVNIGHSNKRVINAITEQANQLEYISPFMGFSHPSVLKLTSLLKNIVPIEDAKFYFVSSGSEAVERALMIARQYFIRINMPRKNIIIGVEGSFHGSTFGCFSAGGLPNLFHFYGPLMPGFVKTRIPNCYRCEYKKDNCSYFCINQFRDLVKYYMPDNIAAFIVEPIMNAMGIIVPPPEFLKEVAEICRKNNILFICDEIVTGFGRTGSMFACEDLDIQPDIITCAKGLSSGYMPISAAIVSGKIAQEFTKNKSMQDVYNSTFGCHPIACAAALANIQVVLEDQLVQNAYNLGKYIEDKFLKLLDLAIVGDIRGKGLMWGIEIVSDKLKKTRFPKTLQISKRIEKDLYERGLLCRVVSDVIRLFPPLISTKENIDEIFDIIYDYMKNLENEVST